MHVTAQKSTLPNDAKNFNLKLLIGLGAASLFFFGAVFYLMSSNSLSETTRIGLIIVALILGIGLFCYWKLFRLDDEEKRMRLIVKLGGRKLLSDLDVLEADIRKSKLVISKLEAHIESEVGKGEVMLTIPAATLQSFELIKRIVVLLERRTELVNTHLEIPTKASIETAKEFLHKELNLQRNASKSLIVESEYPPIPFEQYQGTLNSLVSHINQQLSEKKAA